VVSPGQKLRPEGINAVVWGERARARAVVEHLDKKKTAQRGSIFGSLREAFRRGDWRENEVQRRCKKSTPGNATETVIYLSERRPKGSTGESDADAPNNSKEAEMRGSIIALRKERRQERRRRHLVRQSRARPNSTSFADRGFRRRKGGR